MSRFINFVLGATALVAGGVAYHLSRELEKQKTSVSSSQALLTSSQALLPKPGQTSYAQMRLFYTPPMVRAWSPTYSGGVTDADLYAEAQRVYKLQLENAEPKDAWDRDSDIQTPLPPPRDALPLFDDRGNFRETPPLPSGDASSLFDDSSLLSIKPIGGDGTESPREAMPVNRNFEPQMPETYEQYQRRKQRLKREFESQMPETYEQYQRRKQDFESQMPETYEQYQRRKQDFESKYEGTYEEYLAAQKEARRTGRVIFPTPRRQYITKNI